jgi:NADH-ubiquinone oxidoreductase chain 6
MNNLFILLDSYISGYFSNNIEIISILSITCAIFVIISKNPIISVLFLIGLFLCVSAYLMFLGLNFIALSYLLVYIGAISILFLFILMLINIRTSELQTDNNNSLALALIIGVIFYYFIYIILPFSVSKIKNNEFFNNIIDINNNNEVFYVTSST